MDIEEAIKEIEEIRSFGTSGIVPRWELIEVVLNELDKKDKIINEMAEHLLGLSIYDENIEEVERLLCSKEEAIDYFTKKVSDK